MCNAMYSCVWHTAFILHAAFTSVTYCIHVCDVMHSYMWYIAFILHAALIRVTYCIHVCDVLHSMYMSHSACPIRPIVHCYVSQGAFMLANWCMHTCDMPSRICHVTRSYVTSLISFICDMTHPYFICDSSICDMTWLMSSDMRTYVTWPFTSRTWRLIHMSRFHSCVTWFIHTSRAWFISVPWRLIYMWQASFMCDMTNLFLTSQICLDA